MDNRTYIQEQNIDGTYKETKYYFDMNSDTSKNSSVDLSDSPIDARKGITLQDKRVVNMKTVGLSGKFSELLSNNPTEPFKVSENRLAIIIEYFENALARQQIYRVVKKGNLYENMMLNSVNLTFGEHRSTVTVSLSFIEVVIIDSNTQEDISPVIGTTSEIYYTAEGVALKDYIYNLKLKAPRMTSFWDDAGGMRYRQRILTTVENSNSEDLGDLDIQITYKLLDKYGEIMKDSLGNPLIWETNPDLIPEGYGARGSLSIPPNTIRGFTSEQLFPMNYIDKSVHIIEAYIIIIEAYFKAKDFSLYDENGNLVEISGFRASSVTRNYLDNPKNYNNT